MTKGAQPDREHEGISRRNFVWVGGAALAGGAVLSGNPTPAEASHSENRSASIQGFRTLGRTGWEVSDIGMGSVPLRESAVVRYAYDKGVNYFDTAEGYGNGAAERAIGEAMQHMDRTKIFITSKMGVREEDTESTIVDRVRQSLERLRTDHVDAYYMHGPATVEALSHSGFHAAIASLKAEGRVRFTGLSYHGPYRPEEDCMDNVLCAAAEDGRFDLMLMVYNFLNHEEADRVIATCKANNVGTTAMKTSPGVLRVDPVDPENLTDRQEQFVERFTRRGTSREAAVERLQDQARRQQETQERTQPFAERYSIQSQEQLRLNSIHWVIQNPDMHTACVAFTDFDLVDKVIPLSGTALSSIEAQMLREFELALSDQYCRHGCNQCAGDCPKAVPVSTIMRYAYYFEGQGREKYAMQKYGHLDTADGSACGVCSAPCTGSCPNNIDVQQQVLRAHSLLTLG